MKETSKTSNRPNSKVIGSVTSSPASASGVTLCVLPDGQTKGKSGQALVPADLSAKQASELGLLTSGTYGRTGSISSSMVDRPEYLSLVSRLHQRAALLGSTLFNLTWKERKTPSGQWIFALRASARPTFASDCIGSLQEQGPWVTPQHKDFRCGQAKRYLEAAHAVSLNDRVMLVPYNTPRATDGSNGGPSQAGGALSHDVSLMPWVSPQARDSKGARTSQETAEKNCRPLNEQAVLLTPQTPLAPWLTPMAGTPAQNGNNEAGNNDFSRRIVALIPQTPLVPWSTPKASDGDGGRTTETEGGGNSHLQIQARLSPDLLMDSGQVQPGSDAQTGSTGPLSPSTRGQLNPGLSRWLMGLPLIWDWCALKALAPKGAKLGKVSSGRSSTKAKRGQAG